MDRYSLKRRDRSEASYIRHNPGGEKFCVDLTDRDLFIAGVALYIGEGDKTGSDLTMTNSDPRVLNLWVRFLKQVCNVLPERLKVHIDYYEDLDYPALAEYWSQTLGIPSKSFQRPTLKTGRLTKGNLLARRSVHGTVHIGFNDSKLKALMISWMDQLLDGKL